jgi:hypothetical protein
MKLLPGNAIAVQKPGVAILPCESLLDFWPNPLIDICRYLLFTINAGASRNAAVQSKGHFCGAKSQLFNQGAAVLQFLRGHNSNCREQVKLECRRYIKWYPVDTSVHMLPPGIMRLFS